MPVLKGKQLTAGATLKGGTQGSVVFLGAAGVLTQDSSNLFWDNSAKVLKLPALKGVAADSGSAVAIILDSLAYSTAGAKLLSVRNNTAEKFAVDKDGNVTKARQITSTEADGASAIAHLLNSGALANASAKLLSLQNNSVEKLFVDKDGNASFPGKVTSTTADGGSAVAHILNSPAYSTSGAKLLSLQNNSVEKFFVDKDGAVSKARKTTSTEADGASAIAHLFDSVSLANASAKLLSLQNNAAEKLFVTKDGDLSFTGKATSTVADGASNVAHILDSVAYSTAGAKLLSVRNNGTEKLALDKDGNVGLAGQTIVGSLNIPTLGNGNALLVNGLTNYAHNRCQPNNLAAPYEFLLNGSTTGVKITPASAGGVGLGIGVTPSDSFSLKTHSNFTSAESNKATAAVQTTDATQTTIFSKTLADSFLYWFDATIIGRDTSGAQRALYIRQVRVHRQGGGATLGTIQTPVTDESDAAWDVTWTVNSNDIRLSVTGKAATTINWVCSVWYQGVSLNT